MSDIGRRQLLALGPALAASVALPAGAAVSEGPWTEQGDISVPGGSIHYARMGSGEPLVLLPKLGGWIADWRHAAPLLATQRTVIAIDPPGHGASTVAGPLPYMMTVGQSAAMIMAALDRLDVDRCSIAGQSAGGIAGIVAATFWPDRVRRLALTAVSLIGAMTRDAIRAQDSNFGAGAPGSYGADGLPSPETPAQTELFATIDRRITLEHDASRRQAGRWVRICERGVGRVGVTDYLPRVKQPTLLLFADRGRYVKYVAAGLKLLPQATSLTIANSGSFAAQERPVEWAAAVNRFLDQPDP